MGDRSDDGHAHDKGMRKVFMEWGKKHMESIVDKKTYDCIERGIGEYLMRMKVSTAMDLFRAAGAQEQIKSLDEAFTSVPLAKKLLAVKFPATDQYNKFIGGKGKLSSVVTSGYKLPDWRGYYLYCHIRTEECQSGYHHLVTAKRYRTPGHTKRIAHLKLMEEVVVPIVCPIDQLPIADYLVNPGSTPFFPVFNMWLAVEYAMI
jgi:hypothetical protein